MEAVAKQVCETALILVDAIYSRTDLIMLLQVVNLMGLIALIWTVHKKK
jgi:hypothetical protein